MQFDPDIALNHTRSRIGEPPRQLLGWRRLPPLSWLHPNDEIPRIYRDESRIVRVGEVRWAAVVHANETMYRPGATSLRMGPLGYQSDAQASLAVSYNDLKTYAASLHEALTKPYAPYESIGIREGDDYRQLSTSLKLIVTE